MGMSDCEKCWDTPCTCGWDYRNWASRSLSKFVADILSRRTPADAERILLDAMAAVKARKNTVSLCAIVKDSRARSKLVWQTAIETAGAEPQRASVQLRAYSCDAAYDRAICVIDEQRAQNWITVAEMHLNDVRRLEEERGDASHATEALAALAAL